MITHYYRPKTIKEALTLLSRDHTRALGGGTSLNAPSTEHYRLVDLQCLALDTITKINGNILVGATTKLQSMLESPFIHPALVDPISQEASFNLRNMKSVAGAFVSADGRSPFAVALLALDARIRILHGKEIEHLLVIQTGDLLPVRDEFLVHKLITEIEIPSNVKFSYSMISRTPADKPIVCAALAVWPSGRTRLALGGWGKMPLLAMDGNGADGLLNSAKNAYHEAEDDWASSSYRSEMASILAERCLSQFDK